MRKALLKGKPKLFVALAERAYGELTKPVEVSGLEGLASRGPQPASECPRPAKPRSSRIRTELGKNWRAPHVERRPDT